MIIQEIVTRHDQAYETIERDDATYTLIAVRRHGNEWIASYMLVIPAQTVS